ncbi:MAG: DUF4124 domain-containing protein [Gammaproteobacteria bacterium]|nr:DUF4124 domain-containing protein [Gammaproteobacteria bacterium]
MKILLSLIVLLLSLHQPLFAKPQIYKCLDEYGRPTYSNQSQCKQPVAVNVKKYKNQNETSNENANESDIIAKNKAQQCQNAKLKLKKYNSAKRLTKTVSINGKIQKVRLNNQEKQKAIYDARKDVDYWCKTS